MPDQDENDDPDGEDDDDDDDDDDDEDEGEGEGEGEDDDDDNEVEGEGEGGDDDDEVGVGEEVRLEGDVDAVGVGDDARPVAPTALAHAAKWRMSRKSRKRKKNNSPPAMLTRGELAATKEWRKKNRSLQPFPRSLNNNNFPRVGMRLGMDNTGNTGNMGNMGMGMPMDMGNMGMMLGNTGNVGMDMQMGMVPAWQLQYQQAQLHELTVRSMEASMRAEEDRQAVRSRAASDRQILMMAMSGKNTKFF